MVGKKRLELQVKQHSKLAGHADNAGAPAENSSQDPRRLWRTITNPSTGEVTITNPEDDPWNTELLLHLPHGTKPVHPGVALLEIYVAMVIGDRAKTRDFSDQVALDRCMDDVRTAIIYVLGWVETAELEGLNDEVKHRTIMQQLRGMPIEMLDKTYNRYRMENHGINLDDHPEYRTYQTFYQMGITPPSHKKMAEVTIEELR